MTAHSVAKEHRRDIINIDGVSLVEGSAGVLTVGIRNDAAKRRVLERYGEQINGVPIEFTYENVRTLEAHGHGTMNCFRPVPLGVRCTSPYSGLGSNAFIVHDRSGNAFQTTNAHVLSGTQNDPRLTQQSGTDKVMGHKAGVRWGGTVDLAWVEPTKARLWNRLYRLDKPPRGGVYNPRQGDTLTLVNGRSGVTRTTVANPDVAVNTGTAIEDCIQTANGDDVLPGDSGSPVVYEDQNGHARPVGLVFAKSDYAAYICKQGNIEEATGMTTLLGDHLIDFTQDLSPTPDPTFDPRTDDHALRNELEITGTGTFEIAVSGSIREEGSPASNERITFTANGTKTLWYSGDITQSILSGTGSVSAVSINGESKSPSAYFDTSSGGSGGDSGGDDSGGDSGGDDVPDDAKASAAPALALIGLLALREKES